MVADFTTAFHYLILSLGNSIVHKDTTDQYDDDDDDNSQYPDRGPLRVSRDYGYSSGYNSPPVYVQPQPVYQAPAPAPVYHPPPPVYQPPTIISMPPAHPVYPHKPDLDLTPILFSILPLCLIAGSLLGYAFSGKRPALRTKCVMCFRLFIHQKSQQP